MKREMKIEIRKMLLKAHRDAIKQREEFIDQHASSRKKLKRLIEIRKRMPKFFFHLCLFRGYFSCDFEELFFYLRERKSVLKIEIGCYWKEKNLIRDLEKVIYISNRNLKLHRTL